MTIRIGAVGLGRLGYRHAYNLRFVIPGVELVALCDLDREKLAQTSADWDVPGVYADFEAMISSGKLDAVAITSPSVPLASEAMVSPVTASPLASAAR